MISAKHLREITPILLTLLTVFGVGWLAGGLVSRSAEASERASHVAQDTSETRDRASDNGRRDRGGDRWDRVGDRLGITEAQRAQIDAIRADYRERLEAHREACRAEGTPLREAMQAEIRAVLSEEQASRLDAIRERRENRMERHHGGARGERRQEGRRPHGEHRQRRQEGHRERPHSEGRPR